MLYVLLTFSQCLLQSLSQIPSSSSFNLLHSTLIFSPGMNTFVSSSNNTSKGNQKEMTSDICSKTIEGPQGANVDA